MDLEDNVRIKTRIIDIVFLPLVMAFFVLGVGILTGLMFPENALLQGALRVIIGLVLTFYGLGRSLMILKRLLGPQKGKSDA